MACFVEEDDGTFGVVGGKFEEIGIERHDLEGKVGGGVGVAVAEPTVPPVVCGAEVGEVSKDEGVVFEAATFDDGDGAVDGLPLRERDRLGGFKQRHVEQEKKENGHADDGRDAFDEASRFVRGRLVSPIVGRVARGRGVERDAATFARHGVGKVNESAMKAFLGAHVSTSFDADVR